MFDNGFLHLLVIIPLSIIATPFMTLAGGLCEWIAAVKKARKQFNVVGFVAIKKDTPLYFATRTLYYEDLYHSGLVDWLGRKV